MEAAKQDAREHYAELKAEGVINSHYAMLKRIQQNQPPFVQAPAVPAFATYFDNGLQKYMDVLKAIGGRVYLVNSYDEIIQQMAADFAGARRIISFEKVFSSIAEMPAVDTDPHHFEDVDVCIMLS